MATQFGRDEIFNLFRGYSSPWPPERPLTPPERPEGREVTDSELDDAIIQALTEDRLGCDELFSIAGHREEARSRLDADLRKAIIVALTDLNSRTCETLAHVILERVRESDFGRDLRSELEAQ